MFGKLVNPDPFPEREAEVSVVVFKLVEDKTPTVLTPTRLIFPSAVNDPTEKPLERLTELFPVDPTTAFVFIFMI